MTPLMLAIKGGYRMVADYLISSGADIHVMHPRDNNSALNVAIEVGDDMMVRRLIELGAKSPNAVWSAALRGQFDTVELLQNAGADINASGIDGKSAKDWIDIGGMNALFEEPPEVQIGLERSLRKLVDANPNVDEYAAYHARNTLMFSFHAYNYSEERLNEWAQRFAEIVFDENLTAEVEEKYLSGDRLEEARDLNRRRTGWLRRQEKKRKPEFEK